jgi:hypothetical protein
VLVEQGERGQFIQFANDDDLGDADNPSARQGPGFARAKQAGGAKVELPWGVQGNQAAAARSS